MIGKTEKLMHDVVANKGYLHLTLIDPEKGLEGLSEKARQLDEAGTDGFLVGGSTGFYPREAEQAVAEIKKSSNKPVILFPGGLFNLAGNADAIFFLSLLNSINTYFIVGAQAQAAGAIRRLGLEAIPVGYVVFGKSSMVSLMGMTQEIAPDNHKAAAAYALAGSLMGMRAIYLEGGSGVARPLPAKTISYVREALPKDTLLIVGGGIRERADAQAAVAAGADVVVTGTIVEERGVGSLLDILKGCEEGSRNRARRPSCRAGRAR